MNGLVSQSIGQYQSWTPTVTGFSSATPTIATSRYSINGKKCHIIFAMAATTSNATTMTFTLPFNSKQLIICVGGQATDSGTAQSTPVRIDLAASSNIATIYKSPAATAWTNSGNKGIRVEFEYEIE